MRLNNILSIFAPKDVKFFPLFNETADVLVQASALLKELFSSTNEEQRIELCKQIKAEEIRGDKATGRIVKALNETFITPFDREDVNALADEMDDVMDAMNRAAQKVLLYAPKRLPESTLQLADIINRGTHEIQNATIELPRYKHTNQKLRQIYKEIKRLEEEADAVYENGIMLLFRQETDTIELIKQKEIIQEMEKTANKINNVGKVFKSIFVKYT